MLQGLRTRRAGRSDRLGAPYPSQGAAGAAGEGQQQGPPYPSGEGRSTLLGELGTPRGS